jgi:predicted ribosomally synthesized peptide with nif11-like leader
MQEILNQLQAKLEEDVSLAEKLFAIETPEGVQSLLKEQGIEFTLEEIAALRDAIVKAAEKGESGELSDETLDGVAGGLMNLPGDITPLRPLFPPVKPRNW